MQIVTRGAYVLYIPNFQRPLMYFLYPSPLTLLKTYSFSIFTIFVPKVIHILMYIFLYNDMYKVLGLYDSISHGLMQNVHDF